MNIPLLRTTIQGDATLAAHQAAGRVGAIVAAMNAVKGGVAINVETAPAYIVFDAIVPAEWAALTAQEKSRIEIILSLGTVLLRGTNTRAAFQAAFGAGTTTRANLTALLTRPGTWAEELFGIQVTQTDVEGAR